jgi:hypothetical protein
MQLQKSIRKNEKNEKMKNKMKTKKFESQKREKDGKRRIETCPKYVSDILLKILQKKNQLFFMVRLFTPILASL